MMKVSLVSTVVMILLQLTSLAYSTTDTLDNRLKESFKRHHMMDDRIMSSVIETISLLHGVASVVRIILVFITLLNSSSFKWLLPINLLSTLPILFLSLKENSSEPNDMIQTFVLLMVILPLANYSTPKFTIAIVLFNSIILITIMIFFRAHAVHAIILATVLTLLMIPLCLFYEKTLVCVLWSKQRLQKTNWELRQVMNSSD